MNIAEKIAAKQVRLQARLETEEQARIALHSGKPLCDLADLAGVPDAKRAKFWGGVGLTVWLAWQNDWERREGQHPLRKGGELVRIATIMELVAPGVVDLDDKERDRVETGFRLAAGADAVLRRCNDEQIEREEKARQMAKEAGLMVFSPLQWSDMIFLIADTLAWSVGKGPLPGIAVEYGHEFPPPDEERRPANRPIGSVKDWPFNDFIRELLKDVDRAGGNLGFDRKNGGSGRLIRAIQLLTPFLPPEFAPDPLPLSTIERIKQKSRKK